MRLLFIAVPLVAGFSFVVMQKKETAPVITIDNKKMLTGADQTEKYLPYLQGKRVAILGNQTSIIANTHMVDSLKARGVNIVKVFGPEHGFRAGCGMSFLHQYQCARTFNGSLC